MCVCVVVEVRSRKQINSNQLMLLPELDYTFLFREREKREAEKVQGIILCTIEFYYKTGMLSCQTRVLELGMDLDLYVVGTTSDRALWMISITLPPLTIIPHLV